MVGLGGYGDEIFTMLDERRFGFDNGSVFRKPYLVSLDVGMG